MMTRENAEDIVMDGQTSIYSSINMYAYNMFKIDEHTVISGYLRVIRFWWFSFSFFFLSVFTKYSSLNS